MIDFHSHVLPQIDDGARSVEESVEMLLSLKEQGVTTVVATPHYKGQCTVGEFLEQRQASYERLSRYALSIGAELPEILLGAEVALETYTSLESSISKLSIGETNAVLIEMPFSFWNVYMFRALRDIADNYGLQVLVAHVDRYYSSIGNKKQNRELLAFADEDYIIQINTSSLAHRSGRKLLKKLASKKARIVFGSDCHNMDSRKPVFDKYKDVIRANCNIVIMDGKLKRV